MFGSAASTHARRTQREIVRVKRRSRHSGNIYGTFRDTRVEHSQINTRTQTKMPPDAIVDDRAVRATSRVTSVERMSAMTMSAMTTMPRCL
ncbi:Hypothetical protein SMAX5B_016124 [Scophthalmus maximus]|uniref:Uncharacterized protein n=1 Tax=Scophthalmus maximus TaxID=52904 RepID=A0A2U9BB41_SCOMX|nr:Hypothetical protein SMAX5B_016124 [Scophthalmus maximus]